MNNLQITSKHRGTGANQFWRIILCVLCAMHFSGSASSASQAVRVFNEADAELNKTYQAVLSTITDSRQRSLFVAAQKAWIKYRDASVAFNAEYDPTSKGGLFLNTDLTGERTTFLKRLLANPPPKP